MGIKELLEETLEYLEYGISELYSGKENLPDYNANESGKTTLGQAEYYLDITKDKLEHIIEKELNWLYYQKIWWWNSRS